MADTSTSKTSLESAAHDAFDSAEFEAFWPYRLRVEGEFARRSQELSESIEKQVDAMSAEYHQAALAEERALLVSAKQVKLTERSRNLWGVAAFGISAAAIVAYFYFANRVSTRITWTVAVVSTLVLLVTIAQTYRTQALLRLQRLSREESRLENELLTIRTRSLIERRVSQQITTIVNEIARVENIISVPRTAPRLVELDPLDAVRSEAINRAAEFIRGHETSAIGISGSRGVGKSTLLRSLWRSFSATDEAIYISAPAAYDGHDFVNHLLSSIAQYIVDQSKESRRSATRLMFRDGLVVEATRFSVGYGCVALGALMVGGVVTDLNLDLSAMQISGLPILIGGALLMLYTIIPSLVRARSRQRESIRGRGAALRLAMDDLNRLEFDIERAEKSKNAFSPFDKVFSIEDEESESRRLRSLSRADSGRKLRELLTAYAHEIGLFVVVIDELDKLPGPEQLIEVINILKDLFHIDGVHFAISVSTDALENFTKRGFEARDAFDSSFDEIFLIGRLSVSESVEILNLRAAGFPRVLSLFCHAWSGGLPRDLIRTARRCVEVGGQSASARRHFEAIVDEVVRIDLKAVISSKLRTVTLERDDEDLLVRLTRTLQDPSVRGAAYSVDATCATDFRVGLIAEYHYLSVRLIDAFVKAGPAISDPSTAAAIDDISEAFARVNEARAASSGIWRASTADLRELLETFDAST